MKSFFVTGSSRGLGAAFVQNLQNQGEDVWSLARGENSSPGTRFESYDLARKGYLDFFHRWLSQEKVTAFYLINNAGLLGEVSLMGNLSGEQVMTPYKVNLEAPLLLMNSLTAKVRSTGVTGRILNISSGAGRKPMAGWSLYCGTKAALDMTSRVLAQEAEQEELPLRVLSMAPGVVDTGMQAEIRGQKKENFPLLDKFHQYHKEGALLDPKRAAEVILSVFLSENYENGALEDIRNFL